MSPIFTLDFEASCLPQHGRSFPIEVGVAGPGGLVRAWLIRPEAPWRDWTWTEEAQALHSLTFEQLFRDGLPARQVLRELTAVVGTASVFADSYLDARWMRTLEAAIGAPPLINIRHVEALIDQLRLSDQTVAKVFAAVNARPCRRHRAANDARWLQAFVAELRAEAEAIRPQVMAA